MVDKDDLKFVGMYLAECNQQFVDWMDGQGFDSSECDEIIMMLDPNYEPDD